MSSYSNPCSGCEVIDPRVRSDIITMYVGTVAQLTKSVTKLVTKIVTRGELLEYSMEKTHGDYKCNSLLICIYHLGRGAKFGNLCAKFGKIR